MSANALAHKPRCSRQDGRAADPAPVRLRVVKSPQEGPGAWPKAWKYYGHDIRLRPTMAALKKSYHPLVRKYRNVIRQHPGLDNRETWAAIYVALIRFATSPKQIQRALVAITKLYGYDKPSKRIVVHVQTMEEVKADLLARLEAMRKLEASNARRVGSEDTKPGLESC